METINAAEIKLLLFREIDKFPDDLLLELKMLVQKMTASVPKRKLDVPKRQFGGMKGFVTYMAPDFNEPIDGFKL